MPLPAPLDRDFFARDTLVVARELIGTTLAVGRCAGRIVETEAYVDDAASHFVTRRNQAVIMATTYGRVYVYFIYGMYYCLNFTADATGPGAVLIRAIEPTRGIPTMMARRGVSSLKRLTTGPGRLCQALDIDLSDNDRLIGRRIRVLAADVDWQVEASPRIGISQAQHLHWRFSAVGNPFVMPHKPVTAAAKKPRRAP
ncbi:MAG: DNA-3-methyladenine glycosylase [Planctomycetes bacterium]|nr:DNA-3-methyladenine glycosylase [Planctomycetota bacterium]